jgi:ABC-type transport system involved in multi-copper enzyme maturation permease subunit
VSIDTVPSLTEHEVAPIKVTPWRVLKAEVLKIRTLRSTYYTMAITVAAMALIGFIICWSTANDWNQLRPHHRMRFNPLEDSLAGYQLAQLSIGVFGVLMTAGEYSTGMVRSTFAAVPKRLPVLWSKALVAAVVGFVTMLPAALFAFFASQRTLSRVHIQTTWSGTIPVLKSLGAAQTLHVPRTVIGVALYLTVVVVLGVGLGSILRNVAGAIATLVGVLLILPVIASALPTTWGDRINKWLPSNAGQALLGLPSDNPQLSPWTGYLVFVAYAVGTLLIASWILRRKDA